MRRKLSDKDRQRLTRILRLLGSDVDGERASAALSAHRMIEALGTDWDALLQPAQQPQVVKLRDWDLDQREAAESRIRQLKTQTERQDRQLKALRTRLNRLLEEKRRRVSESDE